MDIEDIEGTDIEDTYKEDMEGTDIEDTYIEDIEGTDMGLWDVLSRWTAARVNG